MRVVSFQGLLDEMKRKPKQLLIYLAICIVGGLILSFVLTQKASASAGSAVEEYERELAEYEANLAEYDNSIQAYEENLATIQQEYDEQKAYCEESIYMQLDSTAFWVGEVQYTVTAEGNLSYTLTALTSYINSSEMRVLISQGVDGIDTNYLKEILITSTSGNTLTITVYHYEEETARMLLDAVEEIMEDGIDSVANAHGSYTLERVVDSVSLKADSAILTAQNTQLNNLRTYTTNLSDTKNNLSNKQQEKENYIENSSLEAVSSYGTGDWMKDFVKYFVLGMIVFGLIVFAWLVLKNIFGRRLQSTDYLDALGIHIIGQIDQKGNSKPSIERSCLEIAMLSRSNQHREDQSVEACIGVLISSKPEQREKTEKWVGVYRERLCEEHVELYAGYSEFQEMEELKKISVVGKVVLLVQMRDTTYEQIDGYVEMCKRYQIEVLGAVVIE